jgi:hypothetical protein
VSRRRAWCCMMAIRTRCHQMRSACRARCISIVIACRSAPAGSVPTMSENSSLARARSCPSTAPNAWPRPRPARPPLFAAPASDRSGRRRLGVSDGADASTAAHLESQVERLDELLQTHGDVALRNAFKRGLTEQAIGVEYIAHYLGRSMPARPFDEDRPSTLMASTRRAQAGPGRRRRPQGRSAAQGLDAAEHGGIVSPRRGRS